MPLFTRASVLRPRHIVAVAVLTSTLLGTTQIGGAGASTASSKAQAKKYLLTLSDMPRGWKAEKGSTSNGSGSIPGAAQLASCIGVPSKLINSNPPEVDSPYYENKSGSLEVQDSVSIFASATLAKAELSSMANPNTPSCMTTLMNGAFKSKLAAAAKGAQVGTIAVSRLQPGTFKNGTTGLVVAVPVSDQGVSVTAVIELVYYVKGKFGQQLSLNSYGSAFPTSTAKSLVSTAINRL